MSAPVDLLLDTSMSAAAVLGPSVAGDLPGRAQTVVVGGGLVGAATAAALAELGEHDVLLLERADLASGTTWHAAGLLARIRGSAALSDLAAHSVDVYSGLEELTGLPVGFRCNGSVTLARVDGRVDELRTMAAHARQRGVAHELLPGDRLPHLHPLASANGVKALLHQPDDAMVNPGWAAAALARRAAALGVAVRTGADVAAVLTSGSGAVRRVTGVRTSRGDVEAERVVLCCGIWTRDLAAGCGVTVALYAAEHVHVTSGPVAGVRWSLPLVRDVDASLYVRPYCESLVIGAFEPCGKPRSTSSFAADGPYVEFAADWAHFAAVRAAAEGLVPALPAAGYTRFLSAPESFTPDAHPLLGEAPELPGLFVGAGFNSQGVIYGPGAGHVLAEWVVAGAPQFDAGRVDVARFAPAQGNRHYLHERTREALGALYALHWPRREPTTARGVRHPALLDRWLADGARLGETDGWERPLWFSGSTDGPDDELRSFRRPGWLAASGREHRAARERLALLDLSILGKVEVSGPHAVAALERTFATRVDITVGSATPALALDTSGAVAFDSTLLRLAEDRFLVLLPTVRHRAGWWRITRACAGSDAHAFDATAALAVLHLAGPGAAATLAGITAPDDGPRDLPAAAVVGCEVASALGHVAAISRTGGPGIDLLVPSDYAVGVLDAIRAAEPSAVPAGAHAAESLRVEAGEPVVPADVGPGTTPSEVGLEALLREAPVRPRPRRLAFVALDDPAPVLWGGEPVLLDGVPCGTVTSGAYGHTVGRAVGIARLDADLVAALVVDGPAEVRVDVLGVDVAARADAVPALNTLRAAGAAAPRTR